MPFIVLLFCGLLALPPIVLSCCTDFWSSSSSAYIVLDMIPGHFGPLSGRYVIALWILIKPWLPCSLKLKKKTNSVKVLSENIQFSHFMHDTLCVIKKNLCVIPSLKSFSHFRHIVPFDDCRISFLKKKFSRINCNFGFITFLNGLPHSRS